MKKMNRKKKSKSIIIVILLISSICFQSSFTISQFQLCQATSDWNQASYNDFINGTIDNLSIIGKGTNARLAINLSEFMTWQRMKPTNKPIARFGHAVAPIWGTDQVLLFGGQSIPSGSQHLADTWVYDYSDNTWTQKAPIKKPGPRRYHRMAPIWGTDKVVLYGGTSMVDSMDDIWVYDLSEDNWTEKAKGPIGSYNHAMSTIEGDDKVLIVAGLYQSVMNYTYLNQTWVYDLSEDNWISKAESPFSGWGHGMASIDGTDKYVVFGGISGWGRNDTWLYDYSEDKWTLQKPEHSPGYLINHQMTRIPGTDNALLFGGYGLTMTNETWLYDLSEDNWMKKETQHPPSKRQDLSLTFIYGVDRILLFGGSYWNYPIYDNYYDTWLYRHQLPTRNGTFISEPFDCGQNSSFFELQWFANMPKNTSVRFQLRTADNATNLNSSEFVGFDGTKNTFYTKSPTNTWMGHNGHRWIQYKIYLNINVFTDSPTVKDVTVTYNCLPEIFVIGPDDESILTHNKPTFQWKFKDLDSAHQRSFQLILDNDPSFKSIDFYSSEQYISDESWSFPAGTNYTELPEGEWYWKVRAKDEDDVWTPFSESRAFVIDTHAPSSAVVQPIQDGFYNELNAISGIATDGDNATGISAIEFLIKNVKTNEYWNGTTWVNQKVWLLAEGTEYWTYDVSYIPWVTGQRYFIQSRAKDLAANLEVSDSGNYFRIDTESPITKILSIENGSYVNSLNMISGISIDPSGSGINRVEISIQCIKDTNWWDNLQNQDKYFNGKIWVFLEYWLKAEGTINWTYDAHDVTWSSGNHYILHARAIDQSGNIELPEESKTIFYDDEPPTKLSIKINDDEKFTNLAEVTLSLNAEDYGFGVSDMSFSTNDLDWTDWITFNESKQYELSEIEEEKIIYFRIRDKAMNIAPTVFDSIILDTTPPTDLRISINDNDQYSSSEVVSLSLEAYDSLSGTHQMAFSFDGVSWTSWEQFTGVNKILLPSGDGTKNVYFKVKDRANNIAIPVYDTITLDSKKPHLLAISINDDAKETNDTTVTLKLSAYDDISGVDQMSFSFNGDAWSAWETFKTEKTIILTSGDGEKNVYFRVNDHADNTALPVAETIILNTTIPSEVSNIVEDSEEEFNLVLYLFIIIVVILILSILIMINIIRRRVRDVQEMLPPSVLSIKPGGLLLPSIKSDEIVAILESGKTPKSTTLTIDAGESPQAIPPVAQTQVPALPSYNQNIQNNIAQKQSIVPPGNGPEDVEIKAETEIKEGEREG
jgi:hypothetical protein